jgi:hypothetical protein
LTTDGAGVTDWLPPASGAPGAPQYAVQFNDPLGTFAGDANLTWYPSGTASPGGSTSGGLVNKLHSAFGSTAEIDMFVGIPSYNIITVADQLVADFGGTIVSGIGAYRIGLSHTGASATFFSGMDLEPTINLATTGPVGEAWSIFSQMNNAGAGTVGLLGGLQAAVFQLTTNALGTLVCVVGDWHVGFDGGPASGLISEVRSFGSSGEMRGGSTVTQAVGVEVFELTSNDGANTITANYGIYVHDQTAPSIVGGTLTFGTNYNIFSEGAASRNVFEGTINFGTATNTPQNGDVWFDGTDLKLRTGGVTKTFTVT